MKTFPIAFLMLVLGSCGRVDCKALFLDSLSTKVDSATTENDLSDEDINALVKKVDISLGYDGEQITYPDTFNFCKNS